MERGCGGADGPYRSDEDVAALVADFEELRLPRERWTHAAHLTVALWCLRRSGAAEATERIRAGIQRYNAAKGVRPGPRGGYHETLTLFWIEVVRRFLAASGEGLPLWELANRLIASAGSQLPLEHYSEGVLFSPGARAGWVAPDRKPLA